MRQISMHVVELMWTYHVTFLEGNRQVGKKLTFQTDDKLYEILRRCHNPIEDHNHLERMLVERRPGQIKLRMTDEQYFKLFQSERKHKPRGG